MRDLEAFFEKHSDQFLKFTEVKLKKHDRKDMHAFLLLHELVPCVCDMIAGAAHDEIWLGVEAGDLNTAATDEQLIDLIRCGVRLDEHSGLCMFV